MLGSLEYTCDCGASANKALCHLESCGREKTYTPEEIAAIDAQMDAYIAKRDYSPEWTGKKEACEMARKILDKDNELNALRVRSVVDKMSPKSNFYNMIMSYWS